MRNLTVKRIKTFVASLAKMKVYIEDATSEEIKINGIPCRKLGELKNGEECTFQIGEEAAKVFVIADKWSKNYCNEFYQLPEGQEDIVLSGKNKYNITNGNAFRFDNNNTAEVLAARKRSTKKGLIVLIICVVVGAVCGFFIGSRVVSGGKAEAKTFSSNGLTITLTDAFQEKQAERYAASYQSKYVIVFALKEEFSLMEGFEDYTLDQYMDLLFKANKDIPQTKLNVEGLTGFVYDYTDPDTNKEYRYYSYVYKAEDAFWTIQFFVPTEKADEYENQIVEWAKSVQFSSNQ